MSELVGVLVARLHREFNRHLADLWQELGLGPGQHPFLLALAAGEGRSQDELSRQLLTDKANTARIITRLESHGLVVRQVDPLDRRRQICRLTASGLATVPLIQAGLEAADKAVTATCTAAERQDLKALLERCLEKTMLDA